MKGLVITSNNKQYIALMPLEYGWWVATIFTKKEQSLWIVLEDNWAKTWPDRGIPIEIKETS